MIKIMKKLKMNNNLFCLLCVLSLAFSSCDSKPPIEQRITIVSNSSFTENESDPLPSEVKSLMTFSKCSETDVILIPKVSVFRSDLKTDNKKEIKVPGSIGNDFKKKLGSYGVADLKNDYAEHLPTMKAGKFLSKKGDNNTDTPYSHSKNALVLKVGESEKFKSIQDVKKHIDEITCQDGGFGKEIVVLLPRSEDGTSTTGGGEGKSLGLDPCQEKTIPKALELKDAISEVINTGKSLEERLELAEKIWAKYFSKNAYVALYQNRQDNNPDVWNPGSGEKYFTNRLAMLESIVGVAVFRVEYSKINNKISGIHIVECQNASEAL